jgi:hypothetical protein
MQQFSRTLLTFVNLLFLKNILIQTHFSTFKIYWYSDYELFENIEEDLDKRGQNVERFVQQRMGQAYRRSS